jgi:hypothetical protein
MSVRIPETARPAMPTTTTRKPPPKVRAAIEALVTGQVRTIKAAAARVGVSREYLSRAFSLPHNAEALRTRAAREVALSSGRAAARLNQLIDSTSQRVALEATKFSLGVAGIKPAEDARLSVSVELKAGYVIDLSEPGAAVNIVGGVVEAPAPKVIDATLIDDEKPIDGD